MGIASSKADSCEALRLCKERKKFIKKAIDSRYDFAAAHLAYVQSLRSIGIALRRFAEAEVLLDSSSATEIENPQTHSSTPSTSPPHLGGAGGVSDGSPLPHHHQSPVSTVSYMRSGGTNAVTVSLNPSKIDISTRVYVDDVDSMSFTMPPPPPPPPPESASNWDYFDHADDHESFSFVGHDGFHVNFNNMTVHKQFPVNDSKTNEGSTTPPESLKKHQNGHDDATPNPPTSPKKTDFDNGNDSGSGALICRTSQTESKDDSCLGEGESEDPSEFITHRAKDFLSSIKEIESRFFLTSESGKEVSRMLEVNKIQVGYSETKGSLTASNLLCGNCCKGTPALVSHDPTDGPRIITWKRSMSSHSSSSRNPLAANATSKDGNDEIGIDFIEEFCMIAGSHSSTLDRLYAWERKLYDEVKASESIRKEYDRKCERLRHQFAKDLKTHVIDKTRALVKDLHSRIIVALHTVDSISKRIEKMRDEELQPQLLELIQGLNRMWKAMLESHHTQYITIQLAYHLKTQKSGTHQEESKLQIMADLQREIECFGLSFINMVNSQTSYVESINNWLKNCIIQPKERVKGRRPFSPRRALGPPIFVICRDWSSGIQTLPAQQLSDAIKGFLSNLNGGSVEEVDRKPEEGEEVNGDVAALNLGTMQLSLTKVLDGLTKFSEASLKMYEDIKEKSEKAQNVYLNYRPPPRAFSI